MTTPALAEGLPGVTGGTNRRRYPASFISRGDAAAHSDRMTSTDSLPRPLAWMIMSTTAPEPWTFTVPEDDAELLAELRRHGVKPGQHLRVNATPPGAEVAPRATRAINRRRFGFIGVVKDGPSDMSARTDEYLEQGFGRD